MLHVYTAGYCYVPIGPFKYLYILVLITILNSSNRIDWFYNDIYNFYILFYGKNVFGKSRVGVLEQYNFFIHSIFVLDGTFQK